MAPLTVWAAHSSAVAISAIVAPSGARNISIRASCLVPFRRWIGAVATSAGVVVASASVIPSVVCASGVARRVVVVTGDARDGGLGADGVDKAAQGPILGGGEVPLEWIGSG